MDGSVLAVLAAYQNNLVTSKMMTSQVAQWFPTSNVGKIQLLTEKSFKDPLALSIMQRGRN